MRVKMFRKHVTKFLSAYCHGELSVAAAQQVKTHLEICARCRKEYEEIKLGVKLAEQLQSVSAPPTLWPELVEKLTATQKQTVSLPIWKFALAATSVALLAFSGWMWLHRNQAGRPQVARTPEGNNVPAPPPIAVTPTPRPAATVPPPTPQAASPQPKTATPNHALPTWEVASLTGAPRIGNVKITDTGKLPVGEWLETDNASRAKIKVAEIGYVDIDPNSRVRLVRTKDTEHRIALAQGKMSALILAPPRLFIVDTPSATAIDLGCAYTLEVDEFGASLLHVISGWVSFVHNGQESFIPAGALCATRKGIGVGTPYLATASTDFRTALMRLDFEPSTAQTVIRTILSEARLEDTLTLWHLLGRQFNERTAAIRGQIFDRMAELTPPPANVTRAGIIKGDRKMLELWWGEKIR